MTYYRGEMRTSSGPRSLTQMLRDADDATLVRMLLDRPDLAFPTPEDFSQVASRATTRHSVASAVDLLHAFELWLAHELVDQDGPAPMTEVAPDLDQVAVAAGLGRLRDLALAWGDESGLRPVRVLATTLGDRTSPTPPSSSAPELDVTQMLTPGLVDKVAAGSAFEFVRRMDVLVEHCDHQPLRRRRDGGLTSRQVRGLGELLDVPSGVATTYVALGEAAGLLGLSARGLDEVLIPTEGYDDWQSLTLGAQWAQLVDTWLETDGIGAPGWLTRLCLEGLGPPGGGQVVDPDSLRGWVAWRRPRRPANTDRLVGLTLDQATMLGVTALGSPSKFGPAVDAVTLDDLLPARVEHVLVQADLTAIAPGPLTVEAARDLGALADVESRGGATVYRFSAESLRRARDLGWDADEVLETIADRSSTPIPQPLSYLVHDLERQRVGDRSGESLHVHLPPERATPSAAPSDLTAADRLDHEAAAEVVARLRRAEADVVEPDEDHERRAATDIRASGPLAVLREAVETGEPVWFGYVDSSGGSGERLVVATSVQDGVLEGTDVRTREAVRTPVPRITAAHIIRTGS